MKKPTYVLLAFVNWICIWEVFSPCCLCSCTYVNNENPPSNHRSRALPDRCNACEGKALSRCYVRAHRKRMHVRRAGIGSWAPGLTWRSR